MVNIEKEIYLKNSYNLFIYLLECSLDFKLDVYLNDNLYNNLNDELRIELSNILNDELK